MCSDRQRAALRTPICNFPFILLFGFLSHSAFSQSPDDWERHVVSAAHYTHAGVRYAAFHEVADALQGHTYYSTKVKKAVLYLGPTKITVTAFDPFVLLGNRIRQMPLETKYADGDILVPVKFFLPIVKEALAADGGGNGLDLPNLLAAAVENKANGTLIRVRKAGGFRPSHISTRYSRRWLYLDILGGRLDPQSFQVAIESPLVKKVEPLQQEQLAQLSFQLSQDISGKEVLVSQESDEILVSIPIREELSEELIEKLKSDRDKWKIDVVVIDPGHGGKDPGAIGPNGVYEKDVVLGIAKRLKKLLEGRLKIKVYMTRDSDKFISLKERTRFANQKAGKLFISIHANWNPNRRVRGTSTYFLGLAKSDEALEIAQRENAVIQYEGDQRDYSEYDDERIILATMAQNAYNKESQDLAAIIQKQLNSRTNLPDRGVKQAGFYVLVGASMPNVLVETAFISNRTEEKLLKKSSFQQRVAESLFESVKRFKEKYEKELFSGL